MFSDAGQQPATAPMIEAATGPECRMTKIEMPNGFNAAEWNVYAGTPVSVLEPIMEKQITLRNVSILAMLEAGGKDIDAMCKSFGFETWTYKPGGQRGQWRLAWDPAEWVKVSLWGELLSPTSWLIADSDGKRAYSQMATGIFSDIYGRTLEFGAFHWPAHIQPKDRPKARYQAAVESAIQMGELAAASQCRGVLYMGDSNWDTDTGPQTADTDPYFKGEATGLREVQPPEGTHGQRQIDVGYIIRDGGLRVGRGWVDAGGGDHRIHGRKFTWR